MMDDKNFALENENDEKTEDSLEGEERKTPDHPEVFAEPIIEDPLEKRDVASNKTVKYHLKEIFNLSTRNINKTEIRKKIKMSKIVSRVHFVVECLKFLWLYVFSTFPYICPPNFMIYIIHIVSVITAVMNLIWKGRFILLFLNGFLSFLLTCSSIFLCVRNIVYYDFRVEPFLNYPGLFLICCISFGCWVKHFFDWNEENIMKKVEKSMSERIHELQKINQELNVEEATE